MLAKPFLGAAAWIGTSRSALLSAGLLAISAWVAFGLASMLHLQNAFWAAMPVWVVAQSSRGLLFARAFYRIIGTLLGAVAGLILLLSPLDEYVICALLALTASVSAGLTHVLRGPQAYAGLMTGITAAVVVMPAIATEQTSVEPAIARIECTLIGVACVTLIMGFFTPASPRQSFYRKVRQFEHDCVRFAVQCLSRGYGADEHESKRLLGLMAQINAEAPTVIAGSIESHRRQLQVEAILSNCLILIAQSQSLGQRSTPYEDDRMNSLGRSLDSVAPAFLQLQPPPPEQLLVIRQNDPLEIRSISQTVSRILQADAEIASNSLPKKARFGLLAPYADGWLAMRTAMLSGIAVFTASIAAMNVSFTGVEIGALGVAIFSLLLGSMPEPQKVVPKLILGVSIGVLFAVLYRLVIQPEVTSLWFLLASIAPFFAIGAIARTSSRFSAPALDANMCFLLASQAGLPAVDFITISLQSLALLGGALLVAVGYLLLPVDPGHYAELSVRSLKSHLANLVSAGAGSHDSQKEKVRRKIIRCVLYANRESTAQSYSPASLLSALELPDVIVLLKGHSDRKLARRALRVLGFLGDYPEKTLRVMRVLAEREKYSELKLILERAVTGVGGVQSLDAVARSMS